MIMFALKHWKYIGTALAVLSLVSALLVYRSTLITKGYNKGIQECNTGKVDTINNRIETRRGQDEIVRSDTDDEYINSLLNGEL